jgi:hypothetical protein
LFLDDNAKYAAHSPQEQGRAVKGLLNVMYHTH